ncbi:hypothetical protein CP8484711_2032B, partial [Chlamydia psittaci 84-8471/1]
SQVSCFNRCRIGNHFSPIKKIILALDKALFATTVWPSSE